ncbi:MAG: transposase [Verrucomicrobiales bacterium]|nr:transposase [Verrucomicrobiales bacterium]
MKYLWPTTPLNLSSEKRTRFKASLTRWLNGFAHPISNALAEGYNRVIQALKSAARGFRNFPHNRVRIFFLLGKRDISLP